MSRVFIIAEAGVNHNGSEAMALQLVDIAAASGADAIKFQSFSADKLVAKGTAKAAYQQRTTGAGDQHSMLRALELSDAVYQRLAKACAERGIEFMSTPFDEGAADMLLSLGMKRIKVPSGEITNLPFLRYLAQKRLPMIISSGMADLAEIGSAMAAVREVWSAPDGDVSDDRITVLHCTSNYPAEFRDVNLRAMKSIADAFRIPVGYSDHTRGIAVATAAVALGAVVIEKHFTIDTSLPGPDHSASLTPTELTSLVQSIRAVEQCLGDAEKRPTASEMPIRALVRRSVTLAVERKAGDVLAASDLVLLRPGSGIAPAELDEVVGRTLRRDLTAGTTLRWSDLK
ncbi:N-acetylneuraminate synthase [Accumulibacter sp.]|uniref:N-acetylneuraminate synthase n=1 Tax=Accumulibacter sp. TaxID=2053492 RepID=UPI002626FEC6|nr:N-acetylneuraminate synthase [Accumulibacter sp.]